MEPDKFILALLEAVPDHRIEAKKRLQKLVFLLKEAGADCDAEFKLRDYGPYSPEVEESAKFLALLGDIDQTEVQLGYANNLMTVFELAVEPASVRPAFDERTRRVLGCLNRFRTVELEVAATIRFFEALGASRTEAVERTVMLKPSKANSMVIRAASDALNCIH